MAYKIKWMTGGETAERYATKKVAERVLKKTNLTGKIIKTKLGNAGTSSSSTTIRYGRGVVGSGVNKLKWVKTASGVYRKQIVR